MTLVPFLSPMVLHLSRHLTVSRAETDGPEHPKGPPRIAETAASVKLRHRGKAGTAVNRHHGDPTALQNEVLHGKHCIVRRLPYRNSAAAE